MTSTNARLTIALVLALVTGIALASPATATPPGFGGEGGGTLSIELPEDTETASGNVFNQDGPIASAKVDCYYGDELVATTFTDANGDFTLTPPGFGGEGGGTLAIILPDDTEYVGGSGDGLAGETATMWVDGEVQATETLNGEGDFMLTPPGFGGEGGGTF
jgi:hypothetical protein